MIDSAVSWWMRELRLTSVDPRPTAKQAKSAPMNALVWLRVRVMRMAMAMPGSMVCDSADTESALRLRLTKPLKKPLAKPIKAAPISAFCMNWFSMTVWINGGMLLVSEGGAEIFLGDEFLTVAKPTTALVHQQYLVE